MRRFLIAVCSCQRDQYMHAQRRLSKVKDADLVFFMGGEKPPAVLAEDEVWVGGADDYLGLPLKVRKIFEWSYKRRYQMTLKMDNDVLLLYNDISEFLPYDYVGEFHEQPIGTYASGAGYILSRAAAWIVAMSKPEHWAEDASTMLALRPAFNQGFIWTHEAKLAHPLQHSGGRCRTCLRPVEHPKALLCKEHALKVESVEENDSCLCGGVGCNRCCSRT